VAKGECSSKVYTFSDNKPEYQHYSTNDCRVDEKRAYTRNYAWGDINPTMHLTKDKAYYASHLWDGKDYYAYNKAKIKKEFSKGTVFLVQNAEDKQRPRRTSTFEYFPGSIAMGHLRKTIERIDSIIRKADSVHVRDKMEKIGDSDCYVIEAKARTGDYTVWIDLAHGYNIAKAELRKGPGDVSAATGYVLPENDSSFAFVKNVRFKKIGDLWVPIEADVINGRHKLNSRFNNTIRAHYKITEIELNPDHDTLGSFVPDDILDGAKVRLFEGNDGIPGRYTWQDGQVVDENGKVILDCVPKKAIGSAGSKPKSAVRKRPSAWELLRRYAEQQAKITAPQSKARIVHFPKDNSIGRCFFVEPQPEQTCLWHRVLVWPKTGVGHVRGDVNVPAGKMLRLDVWDSGPRGREALVHLGPDDVQILNFYQCKWADDRMLAAASRMTGLKVLFLGRGRFTLKGLKHLTAFRELRALQLPVDVPVESLELIRNLTALRYLCITGLELTDAKMAKVGQLPWLTQLGIAPQERSEGLRHIAKLKSLRYLILQAVRDPRFDRNLAYISDLTELEEIDFKDSIIGDAGLAQLRNMKKLKKLDLFSNPSTGRITDQGIAHLKSLTALQEVRLPSQCLTETGIVHLAEMDSLRKVNVWSNHLTNKDIAQLVKMKSLEDLDLSCPNITDAGLAELCRSSSLKSLSIGRCKVTDAGLTNVANLKSLEYLSVSNVPINGAGLAALKQCPSLRGISLSSVELQSNAITHVTAIPSLEKLRLYYIGTQITDESLNQFSTLTNLKTLSIVIKETSQMPITDAGIAHLSRLKNLEDVWLNHCEKITDKGLKHFEGLTSLRHLRLDKSRVTKAGADWLKDKIPGLSVTVPATMRPARPSAPANPERRTGRRTSTSRTTGRRR